MQIVFQTPQGHKYSAEVVDDRLTEIKRLHDDPSSGTQQQAGTPPPSDNEANGQGNSDNKQGNGGGETPPIPEDRVFIENLQSVLVNNRARKQLRNKQKGSLDLKALVRTQTNSQSVFKQNNRKDSHRNYSVVLLVDESGSMSGEKARLAQELTLNVSKNLEKVGGVEVAVIGFSARRIIEHKRFDNSGHSSLCCINNLTNGGFHCTVGRRINDEQPHDGGNADLVAMEYALDYLMRNKAHDSRPVFIMLSDGAPCNSPSRIAVVNADLKAETFNSRFINSNTDTDTIPPMHQLLSRYPMVNAFGLGMLEGGQQVPKHKVVNDLKQTKTVLLNFLRESIS
jgi:Mg-chelatase subunit ChlD